MKATYDPIARALYITLKDEPVNFTEQFIPDTVMFDWSGGVKGSKPNLRGIEILLDCDLEIYGDEPAG